MPETYTCAKCGKVAKTKQALERHAAYHEDDRPFSCEVCLQRFKNSDDRGKHYRRLRRDGKFAFACQVCHKHFKSQDLLSKHWEILGCLLKQVKSNENSGTEPSSTVGGVEEKGSGSSQPIKELVLENDVKCSCKVCEMMFIGTDNLKKHYKEEHNDTKRQVCIQCGQTLSSKDSLARHYSIFHQNKYPFQCDFCDQKFKIKESLCRHIKFVHKDGGYPCEICKRVFSQPVNLKKHMAMHSNSLDFSCHICGREFRWKQAYQKHMALHRDSNHSDIYMKSDTLVKDSELLTEVTEAVDTVHEIEAQLENDKIPSSFGGNLFVSDPRLIDNTPQFPRNQMTNQISSISVDYDGFISDNPVTASLPSSLPSSVSLPISVPNSLPLSGTSHQRQQLSQQPPWPQSQSQSNRQLNKKDSIEKIRKGNSVDFHGRFKNESGRFNNGGSRLRDSGIASRPDEISLSGLVSLPSSSHNDLINGNVSNSKSITEVKADHPTIASDIDMKDSMFLEPRLKDVSKDLPPSGKEKVQAWQVEVTHETELPLPQDSTNLTDMPTDDIDDLCDIEPTKFDLPKVSALKMDSYLGGKHKLNSGMNDSTLSWKKARIFGRSFGFRSDDSRSETSSTNGSTSGTSGSSGGSSRNNLKELKRIAILKARKELYFTSVPTSEQITAPRYVFKPSSIQGVLKTTKPESDPLIETEEMDKDNNQKPDFKTVLDNERSAPRKFNNPFLIPHTGAKEKSLAALLEPRPDNDTLLAKGEWKEKPVPQIPGAYKFSLVKHMLTLKNEENFDKELFRNPLYSTPADLKGLTNLVERHKVEEKGVYDLSARQICPFQWIGGVKVNNDKKSTSSKNTNSKASSIDVFQDSPEDLSIGKHKSIETIEESDDDDIDDNASDYSYREGKEELVIDIETGRFEKKPTSTNKTPDPIAAKPEKALKDKSKTEKDEIGKRGNKDIVIENVDDIGNINEIGGKFDSKTPKGQGHSTKAISHPETQQSRLPNSESSLKAFDMMKDLIKCTKYTTNALNVDLNMLDKARSALRSSSEIADNSNTGFNGNISISFRKKGEQGMDGNTISPDNDMNVDSIDVNLADQFEEENVSDGIDNRNRMVDKRYIKVPCKSIGGTRLDFELEHLTPSLASSMNSNFVGKQGIGIGKQEPGYGDTRTTANYQVTRVSELGCQIGSTAVVTQSFIPNSLSVFTSPSVPIMSERSESLASHCHGNRSSSSNSVTMSTMLNQFEESSMTPKESEISKTIVDELNEVLCSSLQNDLIQGKVDTNSVAGDNLNVTNNPTSLSGRQFNRVVSIDTSFMNRGSMPNTSESSLNESSIDVSFASNIRSSNSTYVQRNPSNANGTNSANYASRNPLKSNCSGSSYASRNPTNITGTCANYNTGHSSCVANNSSSSYTSVNSLNVADRTSNFVTRNPLNVANVPTSNYLTGNALANEVIDLSDINNQAFLEVTMDIRARFRQSASNGSTSVPYSSSSGSVANLGSGGSVGNSGSSGFVSYSAASGSAATASSVSRSWSVDSSVAASNIPSSSFFDSSLSMSSAPSSFVDSSLSLNSAPSSFVDSSLSLNSAPSSFVGSSLSLKNVPSSFVDSSTPSNIASRSLSIDSTNIGQHLQRSSNRSVFTPSLSLSTASNICRTGSIDSISIPSKVLPRSSIDSSNLISNVSRSFDESTSISSNMTSRSFVDGSGISSNVSSRSFVGSSGISNVASRSFVGSSNLPSNITSRSWSMDSRSPNLPSVSEKCGPAELFVPQPTSDIITNQKEDVSIFDLLKPTNTVKEFEPFDQLLEPCL